MEHTPYQRRTIKLVLTPFATFFAEPQNWSNPEIRQTALEHWTKVCRKHKDEIINEAVDNLISKRVARSFPTPGMFNDEVAAVRRLRVQPAVPDKNQSEDAPKDPEHEMYVALWESFNEAQQNTLRETLWNIYKAHKPETKEGAKPFFHLLACGFFSHLCRAGKIAEISKLSGISLNPKPQQ